MAGFGTAPDEGLLAQDPTRYLDLYWEVPSRHAYLFTDSGSAIGFCLVNRHSVLGDDVWAIAEFYITPPNRRLRHGQAAASEVIRRHGPDWEIAILSDNSAAIAFWDKLVTDVAPGGVKRLIHAQEGEPDRVVLRFNV